MIVFVALSVFLASVVVVVFVVCAIFVGDPGSTLQSLCEKTATLSLPEPPPRGYKMASRAPYAIFAKIGTAPQREHDFRGSGGVKKEPKMVPKPAVSDNLAPRATWEPLGLDFGPFGGPF